MHKYLLHVCYRALRATAFIISVPEVSATKLADRLMEISRKEKLKVNSDALLRLVEISGCDIRSCIGALQYMGGVNLGDNLSFALKDSRKGLFDSWKQILKIPVNRNGILPLSERVQLVLRTVQNGKLFSVILPIRIFKILVIFIFYFRGIGKISSRHIP